MSGTFNTAPVELVLLKQARRLRVSVVLPALDEAETIGRICTSIRESLMGPAGVVDELLVIDSGSGDGTAEMARGAGATVHHASEITPIGPVKGKGDCLWRSLAVVSGEIVVWLDADARNFTPRFVTELVAPLLHDEAFVMSKAFYERPLVTGDTVVHGEGARVTELVARPLLQLFYPELSHIIQPLSGEYAAYTDVARSLPFFTGYGVEVGLLIDIAERYGVDRIAQVDLGTRQHRNRPVLDLGATAFQVITALLRRFDELGRIKIPDDLPSELVQYVSAGERVEPVVRSLDIAQRPPMDSL